MSQWKTGKTKPSKKVIFRLEEAELAAGIAVPKPISSSVGSPSDAEPERRLKVSKSTGGKLVLKEKDMLDILDCARKLVASLERALEK